MIERRVAIVGAGPAGAALALLLVRQGASVVLLEREAAFDRVFRGEALMPDGIDALRQLGLGDAVDRLPHAVIPGMELFVEGARLLRADWPEVSGDNAARAVSQPALIALIVEQAARAAAFELRMGTTVRQVVQTGGGAEVSVRSASGDEVIRADAVVGADGRGSVVRGAAGIRLERVPFPGNVAWLSIPPPEDQRTDPRFQSFTSRHGSLVLYPSWDGRLRVGVNLRPGEESLDKRALLDRIAAIAREPYASLVRARTDAIDDPVLLKVLVGRVQRWSNGRLLLIGDAAHPMAPVRAQGINLALRDAIVAANHLAPALLAGGEQAIALAGARIQQERQPEIVAIQQLQLEAMQLPLPLRVAAFRRFALPVLRRLGVMKQIMLRSEQPFRHGVTEVRLEPDTARP